MSVGRRFIAGASCPSCKQIDKLFMYEKDGHKVKECVRCGFHEVLPSEDDETPAENSGVQVIDLKGLGSDT